ncbi:SA1362 family protein [Staphylococcus auricularis]|uniref:SA1362 family protein n=1 Tax=Staphylococcus auricularis TaxID=29379 RepID=UPI003EBDECDB
MLKKGLFYFILIVAAIGLIVNLDHFIFGLLNVFISLVVIGVILYLIYYFFFLTEDQRKYKKAKRKYRKQHRRR